ncbi:hypothetical protein F8M41_009587 [Gigaspora margarita]|uniref:Uncharacterized protein n=1 Tax=Gigaspora margarita TaxID=4874 RepID=A0A8H4AUV6_GIGMA|nr:hypothetical protein F8M41_009587 [Gigaspora margarita]
MVKVSIILISLFLILYIHLTTTLPAHDLVGRNLTMLSPNISGHKLEKRFDPLNLNKEGKILIRRFRNTPEQFVAKFALLVACERTQRMITMCLCCAMYDLNTVIDVPRRDFITAPPEPVPAVQESRIQGPNALSAMRAVERYLEMQNHNVPYCPPISEDTYEEEYPCMPRNSNNIIRPVNPPNPSHPQYQVDTIALAEFNELFAFYDTLDKPTIQKLWKDYNQLELAYPNFKSYLKDLRAWAEYLGLSIKQYFESYRRFEKGESSASARLMCTDEEDDDDIHDELRK